MSATGTDGESSADESQTVDESRKRKRSTKISCELCKARKVKCDKQEPACGWCASHNRTCVYKERKRPGLRTNYEVDLEEKVNRMEAMLQLLGAKVEDHMANEQSLRAQNQVSYQTPEIPRTQPFDLVSSTSEVASGPSPALTNEYSYSRPPDAAFEPDLPPYDLLYSLVDLYFKHVATWSPILDRKDTFDTLFGKAVLEEPDRILLHAIVAITLRFSRDPRLTPASRKRYHDASKQKVQIYGLENPNIRALQALVILAMDILGTSNGPQGWNLLALIARNVVQLGLHIEKSVYLSAPPYPSISCLQAFGVSQPKSWTENEARRRLFWMVYVLDRYTTVSTSFNFTIDDSEIDRPLPCSYDLFSSNEPVETKWFAWPEGSETTVNNPDNLGSFAYHCEVLRILSRIHKFLNKPTDIYSLSEVQRWRATYRGLDTELNSFILQLPGDYHKISQLCHSDPASKISNWIMLHAAFVTSVIRLHAAAAYPPVSSHIFMPSNQAMQRCLGAVDSLKAIAQDVVDTNGLDLHGPPFAFSLWVAARVLLVHAATMETDVDPKISFFIATLETMGKYWSVAERYARILERLVQEGQHGRGSYGSTGSGQAKSFTAMRRCAYDLYYLVSHRPNSVLDPTSTRLTSSHELEYLDVFDFFNYPRLPHMASLDPQTPNASGSGSRRLSHANGFPASNFAAPNSETDWLNFRPPHE